MVGIIFCILFYSTILHHQAFANFHNFDDVINGHCIRYEAIKFYPNDYAAFYDWPYTFDSCYKIPRKNLQNISGPTSSACQVWSANGTLLFNITDKFEKFKDYKNDEIRYTLPKVEQGNTNFIVIFSIVERIACGFYNVSLSVSTAPSCDDFSRTSANIRGPQELGEDFTIRCEVNNYDPNSPKLPTDNNLLTYQWYRSCSETLENENKSRLSLNSLKREDVGNYICSATYNGMTRFVYQKQICVYEPISSRSDFHPRCDEKNLSKSIGEPARFLCRVDFTKGQPQERDLIVQWQKISSNLSFLICDNDQGRKSYGADKRNAHCFVKYGNKCSTDPDYKPASEDSIVLFSLEIESVTETDYGVYEIEVRHRLVEKINLTLTRSEVPALLKKAKATIAWIIVLIFVVCIVIAAIILWQFPYVKVFYKRHFAGYVIDNKKYGVFLAYHFTSDLDKFAKAKVQDLIPMMQSLLEKMGYTVYDERKDYQAKTRAENVQASIENSHRILILLTPEFIKDDWSLFALQEGFNEMINSGTKLIFVLLPGVKEFLKQHSKTDKTYALIKRALEVNFVIQLPKQEIVKSRKFALHLENALPKLRKKENQKSSSIDSDALGSSYKPHLIKVKDSQV